MMTILCDIGGTNCRLAIKNGHSFEKQKKYKVSKYNNFEDVLNEYIDNLGVKPEKIYMSLAANPDGNIYHFKNQAANSNKWVIDYNNIAKDYNLSEIHIFDDFVTNSMALPAIGSDSYKILRNGKEVNSKPLCIIGAGTGLGISYAVPNGKDYNFIRTYGGHFAVSAVSDEQYEYIKILKTMINRTPIFEDFVCGKGIINIYNIYNRLNNINQNIDESNIFSLLKQEEEAAKNVLRIFAEFYGLFAHITVSCTCSYGGLYITGGITDILIENNLLYIDDFIKSFEQKMVPVVAQGLHNTPIYYPDRDLLSFYGLIYAINNGLKGENL